jgi:hypothetical protein
MPESETSTPAADTRDNGSELTGSFGIRGSSLTVVYDEIGEIVHT